ncbi:hypothetical protein [Nitrosopumilus sp.]|uniref:hypothetical protein n=1 Tax=Nitrosopumilus sp. TaxID=2024843 RepID=UPI002623C450|nr:hypothetical protein [Nitrosopumilus sp.]
MKREPFRKVRSDKKIGNIKDLPKKAVEGRRKDTQLGTILNENNVTNKEELKRKFRNHNRLNKFNQRTD